MHFMKTATLVALAAVFSNVAAVAVDGEVQVDGTDAPTELYGVRHS